MATTSYLYHGLGLRDYRHQKTEYRGGVIEHHVRIRRSRRRCRHCKARDLELRLGREYERRFHAPPVGRRQQQVVLHAREQHCQRCGCVAREPVFFACGRTRYTRSFADYVLALAQMSTLRAVAALVGVGWGVVKDIHQRALRQRLRRRQLKSIRRIAVDEFAIRSGHDYMTVVLDLDTGDVLHVQEGKDAGALRGFLKRLKRARVPLQAVAMDLSAAYRKAVREVYGETVDIVHDPYHIVALINTALDETRRGIMRGLDGERKRAIKGTRFLLLRGVERLPETHRTRLEELSQINRPLFDAHLMKEQLRGFWHCESRALGQRFLDRWLSWVRRSGTPAFVRTANTLEQHQAGLLAYFDHRITSGPLEGLNNKIKTLKRQAYGFRDMDYFKLLLLNINDPLVTPKP